MTLTEMVFRQFPNIRANGRTLHPVEKNIRTFFVNAFTGDSAKQAGEIIDKLIGPDCWNTHPVCIPFVTRGGISCTLYGGWIHADKRISWDVIAVLPDGDAGCLDSIDERYFVWTTLDGEGLECVPTVDMARILRTL